METGDDAVTDDLMLVGLAELIEALGPLTDRILLAGGYGLYLKQLHLAQLNQKTLIAGEHWPAARATNDFDLVLDMELLASVPDMTLLRQALDGLGYEPIENAHYYHFQREGGRPGALRVDLLAPQPDRVDADERIRHQPTRRAGPKGHGRPKVHAWPAEGVLLGEEGGVAMEIPLPARPGADRPARTVRVPHTLTSMLMKLSAYGNQKRDGHAGFEKNAIDLYRVIAMTSEEEDRAMPGLLAGVTGDPVVARCRELATANFKGPDAPGVVEIRQHPGWRNSARPDVDKFVAVLSDYFGVG